MNTHTLIDTPEKIQAYRLLTLKAMLKLEILGMHKSGKSAYSIVKKEFNLKGSKQSVFDQYAEILKSNGYLA
jgi:hypothetical protein